MEILCALHLSTITKNQIQMFTELEFQLCVLSERDEERWLIPKRAQAKPPPFYQIYVPMKDAISFLSLHPAGAKAKVIITLDAKDDFSVVRKALDLMLGNPPEKLEPLLNLLTHKQLFVLKCRCGGLSYAATAAKMNISPGAVKKHCTRIKDKTDKSIKEWIKLCGAKGKLFD